jgi:hypothetical protein
VVAKKSESSNGHDRLHEATTLLIQSMATLTQNQAAFLTRVSETDRLVAEYQRLSAERFARIETDMAAILRVLAEHGRILENHSRILERLPEAIREKIDFKVQQ